MAKFRVIVLALTTILVIAAKITAVEAQTAPVSTQSAYITVSLALDKNQVPVGQSPWAILTIKNLTDHELNIHISMVRLHVEDQKGQRPTTIAQRSVTGKLRAGDAPLAADEYVGWTIAPGESSSHKYLISYFYDLSTPGKHTIYIDVMDPISKKSRRTNTAMFKVVAPSQ